MKSLEFILNIVLNIKMKATLHKHCGSKVHLTINVRNARPSSSCLPYARNAKCAIRQQGGSYRRQLTRMQAAEASDLAEEASALATASDDALEQQRRGYRTFILVSRREPSVPFFLAFN